MRVTQTISIGTLRINSMSNSSIVQIGTSGEIKTRSEEITEQVSQEEANQKIEGKVNKEIKPILKKEGIPVQQPPPVDQSSTPGPHGNAQKAGTSTQKAGTGTQKAGTSTQEAGINGSNSSGVGGASEETDGVPYGDAFSNGYSNGFRNKQDQGRKTRT